MTTISARELRNDYARVLRDVEGGADVTVTSHGRPVAKIVPLRPDGARRPTVVPFEQVAGALAHLWADTGEDDVRGDMDAHLDTEVSDPFARADAQRTDAERPAEQ